MELARRVIGHVDVNGSNKGVRAGASTVAQGLMLTCAHQPRPASEGGDTDTLIITAVSADHPQEVAWAEQAQANGTRVVTVGMEPTASWATVMNRVVSARYFDIVTTLLAICGNPGPYGG